MFPDRNFDSAIIDEYNRQSASEFERIRDFIVLHYHATERTDTELWNYVRTMRLPDTLKHKIDVFKACGRVVLHSEESFQEPSWVSIFIGQNVIPNRYDPIVDSINIDRLRRGMAARRENVRRIVDAMPTLREFVARNWPAAAVA